MFGCSSDARISRSCVARSVSFDSAHQCGSFSAIFRRSTPSVRSASQTELMPPSPIAPSSRYGPTTPPTTGGGAIVASPSVAPLPAVKRARSFRKSSVSCSACFCSSAAMVGLRRVLEASSAASHASRCSAGSSRPVCRSARTSLRSPGAKFCMRRGEAGARLRGHCVLHGSRRLLNPRAAVPDPAGRRIASARRSGTMAGFSGEPP